jgi:WD40 repeat protein
MSSPYKSRPAGIITAGGSDCSLQIWDAENRILLGMGFAENDINCVDWSPRTDIMQQVAAGLHEGSIAIFQYTSGKFQLNVNSLKIENDCRRDAIACIKYAPDGIHLAAGSSCGFVDVFNVVQGVWIGAAHVSRGAAVTSIDWSHDANMIQVSTTLFKKSYWDISKKDIKTFPERGPLRDQVWCSWTSPLGWPVNGMSWDGSKLGAGGAIKTVDVLASMEGTFGIELVKGLSKVPNLVLATTAHGLHLLNFPVLTDAKPVSTRVPAITTTAARLSRDGTRVYSVCGDGLCILQWRILLPDEVGMTGARTRAKRAAEKKFTLLDREKFWKISRKEIDDLRRRGVRSDIIRIVDPLSPELQEARLQVIDFTFDMVDLMMVGREMAGEPMHLAVAANTTWKELLLLLEHFVMEKNEKDEMNSWCFMFDKYKINTREGWSEVSELRLKCMYPSMRQAELIKLKNESRIQFSVKTEADFRQCWHWIEHEYRWILSFTSDVPEGQTFPLSVLLIPYVRKSKKADTEKGKEADIGETSDPESDVDSLLQARSTVIKKKVSPTKEKSLTKEDEKEEKKQELDKHVAPTGWDDIPLTHVRALESAPLYKLTLESMHGYNGRKSRGNIFVLKQGQVVYPVGSSVVVHDRSSKKQAAFLGHQALVTSLAMSPDKETLASATGGEDPELCIWNGLTLVCKQRFRNDHEGCIVALSFARNDSWIASVSGEDGKEMRIFIYDYKKGTTVLSEERAGKNRIISMAFNPHVRFGEVSFVTVGERHVRFWSRVREKLSFRKGIFDTPGGSESMLAVAYTDPDHLSADKDIVLTGSKDGRVWIWRDAKALWNVQTCTGPCFEVLVDGGTVFAGGKDLSAPIREWKIGRGWPTRLELTPAKGSGDQGLTLAAPQGAGVQAAGSCARALAWNGSELIVGTSGNALHTLNPRTGVSKLLLQGHVKGAVTGLAVHPVKPLCVSVGEDGAVRLTNWKDKTCVQYRVLNEPIKAVACAALAPSLTIGLREHDKGEHIAVGLQSGEFRVLSFATLEDVEGLVRDYGTSRCKQHSTFRQDVGVFALQYSPDGKWLALGAGDGLLDLYHIESRYQHVQSRDGHGKPVTAIDWGVQPTESGVYHIHTCSAAQVGTHYAVLCWALKPGKPPYESDVEVSALTYAVVRDEPWHTWTLPSGWPLKGVAEALVAERPTRVARTSDAKMVAVGDSSGDTSVFQFPCVSAKASAVASNLRHVDGVSALVMTPDDSRVISAGEGDQLLLVSLLTPFASLAAKEDVEAQGGFGASAAQVRNMCAFVSLANNLKLVAAVLSEQDVVLWDVDGLADGTWRSDEKARLSGHTKSINVCRFAPDDASICTAASDKSIRLWDLEGREKQTFDGHESDVIGCAYSRHGKLVAGGDHNKQLLVWDASGLAEQPLRAKAEGHRKSVLCVAWADDSRRICTGSGDKTLRIWDVPDSLVAPPSAAATSTSPAAGGVSEGPQGTLELNVVCRYVKCLNDADFLHANG